MEKVKLTFDISNYTSIPQNSPIRLATSISGKEAGGQKLIVDKTMIGS
jgi:hypothetical protein